MNVPNFLSKWRWWLLGGLAMTGIGGWYGYEFQSQQRHAAVNSPASPSIPLPIQQVSPSLTEKSNAVNPTTPVKSTAQNPIGGGKTLPSSNANSTLPGTDAIPQTEVPEKRATATESVPSNLTRSETTYPAQSIPAQPSVSSQPAKSAPARVVMQSRPTTYSKPAVAKSHSSPPSKASTQQAKVMKPAAPAPAATDDLGGNTPPKSTFMAQEKVRFGASSAAPNAQTYAPAQNNTALPAIEPSRISTSPSTSSQPVPSVNSGGSSPSGVNDPQLPRDEGRP